MREWKPYRIRLKLGSYYWIKWVGENNKWRFCKFIKPTKCGYNFLDVHTNECVMPYHSYPRKDTGNTLEFFITKNLWIKRHTVEKIETK